MLLLILTSCILSIGKNYFKYFVGFKNDADKITTVLIKLPRLITYLKSL